MRVYSFCKVASRLFVIALVSVSLSACKTDLFTKLPESEANEIIAILVKNSIPAIRIDAKDHTSSVRVDEENFADAVLVLNKAGLPRQKFATMGEVFTDNKLISTPTEERARYMYALSQELSKTLSEIDGVLAARVHIVLPKNDPFHEGENPASASIFIKYDPTIAVSELLPQIKTLATNGIEGLSYDKVSVVFVPAERGKGYSSALRGLSAEPDAERGTSLNGLFGWFGGGAGPSLAMLLLLIPILGGGGVVGWRYLRDRTPTRWQAAFRKASRGKSNL